MLAVRTNGKKLSAQGLFFSFPSSDGWTLLLWRVAGGSAAAKTGEETNAKRADRIA